MKTPLRTLCLAAPLLAGCVLAHAQGSPALPAPPAALPNADPAPAVRAQRDAVNPLRMIIEAGKLKARPKPATEARAATEAEPPAKRVRIAAGKVPDGSPEASSNPVAVARPAAPQPTAPSPAQGDGAVQATAPAGPASVEAEPAVATLLPVVATRADSDAALDPRRAALAAVTPAPSRAARSPLVLADYVEPVVPERVRNRLRGAPEVVLDLLVRADGSVGEATVRSSTDKALEPLALAAVRQWRYKPIAQDQPHAVQLVFPQ